MRENGSFPQHRHFLHDKFVSNDKSLQIHERIFIVNDFLKLCLSVKILAFYLLY